MPLPNCKIHGKNFEKFLQRSGNHGWAAGKKISVEPLKRLFHHSENTSFCKK